MSDEIKRELCCGSTCNAPADHLCTKDEVDTDAAVKVIAELRAERDALREERVSILVEIADALTTAIRKERWDIVVHVRDAVKETNHV